jgi:hypothetical protein
MKQDDKKELFSSTLPEDLEPVVAVLNEHGITFVIETQRSDYNPNFTFARPIDAVKLLVATTDFDEAHSLLIENGLVADVDVEEGYREMLAGLDNEELLEIAVNFLEYPADQVEMAKKLLAERGIALPKEKIEEERAEIISKQHKPIEIKYFGTILWVLFSIVGAPIASVFSIAVLTLKGKDIDGKSYPLYGKREKLLAKVLLVISLSISIGLFVRNYALQN